VDGRASRGRQGGGRGTALSDAERLVQRVDIRVPRTFPRHFKTHTILELPKNKVSRRGPVMDIVILDSTTVSG
jgi:hypothetical protein